MSAPPAQDGAVQFIPYAADPLAVTAQRLLARCARQLPDLSTVVVLLAEPQAAARLRQLLQEQAQQYGHNALLGPVIDTLRGWVESQMLDAARVISAQARELLLVEALQQHTALLGAASPWRLAENLLELFDELTLQRVDPGATVDDFLERLQCGYHITGVTPAALSQEARLVHTLWRAYHVQLGAEHVLDPHSAYLLRLDALRRLPPAASYIYLVGIDALCPAEAQWCKALLDERHGELILHGQITTHDVDAPLSALAQTLFPDATGPLSLPLSRESGEGGPKGQEREAELCEFLDACYQHETAPLAARARDCALQHPHSPARTRLAIFRADSAEQEAMAIDIQVRRWLIEGRERIGIVTENRRLARRVRALLERAGLSLQDSAGWALSTTRAAAVLERWLETVEDDFAQQPLLDLLKSPFVFPAQPRAGLQQLVHHFEMDILRRENLARGLQRYRRELEYRRHLLPHWTLEMTRQLDALLEALAVAAAPLQRHLNGRRHAPADLLAALQESLRRLGLQATLSADPAGCRVLEEIERMRTALPGRTLRMTWLEFRAWLGRSLEQHNFLPADSRGPVRLLNLAQSRLLNCDALIIAGADRAHLPGDCAQGPFFNQGVRRELGLPTWNDTLLRRLHHFRRLLESAPQVLITWCGEENAEALSPCPWVEALQTFHRLAYDDDLGSTELARLCADPRAQVVECDTRATPAPEMRPTPVLRDGLLPHTVNVSAHQRLIDCPYAFFAADCLQLKAPDEIRTALEKSDYGRRVHTCLQAFHGGLKGLPGPFPAALTPHNRAQAVQLLHDIATAVFAKDLEDNFLHRGWLQRWLQLIPAYIDWQLEREHNDWRVQDVERTEKRALYPQLTLKGRLDRVDAGAAGLGIVDYKTGTPRTQDDVERGEDVQLTSYALLMDRVARVEYLRLDAAKAQVKAALEGESLERLALAIGERLLHMTTALRAGAPLPAWGDADSCAHCDLDGVCRRDAWQ